MSDVTRSYARYASQPARRQLPRMTRFAAIAVLLALWQAISMANARANWFNPVFLPSPSMVLQAAGELYADGILWAHVWTSTLRLLAGFAGGVVTAVLLGLAICRSRWVEAIVDPVLTLIGPIPPFAFLNLFIIWLGVNEPSKLLLIAYSTFLPVLAYTVDGIRSVNPLLIRSARSLGASELQVFRRVVLQSALPNIFVGMRISLALCFSALVVAEMVGAEAGLGYMIVDARNFFKVPYMFLAAALIGLEYSLFAAALGALERRLFAWRKGGYDAASAS